MSVVKGNHKEEAEASAEVRKKREINKCIVKSIKTMFRFKGYSTTYSAREQ